MLRIFHDTRFQFVRHWRIAAVATVAFIVIGIGAFAVTGGVRYSIEFTGGTLMQVRFQQPPDVAEMRSTLSDAGIGDAEITQYGSNVDYSIRAQDASQVEAQAAGAETIGAKIQAALSEKYGADGFQVILSEAVGPRVGSELRSGAAKAMLIASLFTLLYLAVRFDWRFGLAAVLATAHDILITFAFIKLMNLEVSLTIVAAILTLLGYSANDTIIIFDRVRENLRKQRKGESMHEVLDRSINETLPRSVMTHATTMAATIALLIFAGDVIRPFAWVMTFGVFIATFSSMYVAGPLLLWIEHRYPRSATEAAGRAVRAGGDTPPPTRTRSTEKIAAR